jgi:hypothetical protein
MLLELNKIIGIRRVIPNTWWNHHSTFHPPSAHVVAVGRLPTAASRPFGGSAPCRPGSSRKASANLAREGRFGYLLVESTGISEPLPAAEPRLGRRTVLTFPLLPPPQKN